MDELNIYSSYNINKFDMEIHNKLLDLRIFWARVVSGRDENLFTNQTKHSVYEIQYALKGPIGMTIGDSSVSFDESDFLIVPPDTYHQIVSSDSDGARFIMAFSVKINDSRLSGLPKKLSQPIAYRQSPHMRELLSVILAKSYLDDPVRKESITALVQCFLLEVIETVFPPSSDTGETYSSMPPETRVSRIKEQIHRCNGIGMSVEALAKESGISTRQLNRLFTLVEGVSPKEAINSEKLKKIEELIASTELSFNEIAILCGFADEYSLGKFFKRHNLTSLSSFRRLSRKRT